jgi:hypothetical protein
MKKTVICILMVTSLFLCSAVLAADLINKDSKSYEVKIHDVGTTHSSIEGNTTKVSICSDCKIEVVGVGTIKASGSDKIVIKDGSLSKE